MFWLRGTRFNCYKVLTSLVFLFTVSSFFLSLWLRANYGIIQVSTTLTPTQYVRLVRRGVTAPNLLYTHHNFSIEQSDQLCHSLAPKSGNRNDFVFLMIVSSWENSKRRDYIRKTWATYHWFWKNPSMTYSYKFVISHPDPNRNYTIHPTDLDSPDIIMSDLTEHYYLLDIKVMWGFSHVLLNHKFDYILKCDDDTFVNLWRLPPKLLAKANTDYFYGGKVLETHNWAGEGIKYAAGSGYVMSRKTLCAVVLAHSVYSLETPRIPIEDAYTGLLNARMGIKVTPLSGFATEHESCKDFTTVIFHHINMKLFGKLLHAAVNGTHFC